jgi:hypothetical protein
VSWLTVGGPKGLPLKSVTIRRCFSETKLDGVSLGTVRTVPIGIR